MGSSLKSTPPNGTKTTAGYSRWPHWLAWALAVTTFPLIWMGGLVTTYRAGMAVYDWPSTFGYWFFYPLKYWLPVWDVFLEHGHRLFGMAVGLWTIALAISLWRCESRRGMRWLGVIALAGVCYQGALGGLRVVANAVILANIHGCTAPVFFALAACLVVLTSRRWIDGPIAQPTAGARMLRRGSICITALVYLQIVLGAQLRHLLPDGRPFWFPLWVWLHVLNASLVLAGILWLRHGVIRRSAGFPLVRRRVNWLLILFLLQLLLGTGTWLVHYGIPVWFAEYVRPVDYTVVTLGRLQGLTTTLHVAMGSLSLVTSLSLSLWLHRLLSPPENG
jgi:cytochrome c oxidase assembly protein subunit 15